MIIQASALQPKVICIEKITETVFINVEKIVLFIEIKRWVYLHERHVLIHCVVKNGGAADRGYFSPQKGYEIFWKKKKKEMH